MIRYGAGREDYLTDVLTGGRRGLHRTGRRPTTPSRSSAFTRPPRTPDDAHRNGPPIRGPAARRDVRRGDRPRGRRRSTRRTSATSRRRSGTARRSDRRPDRRHRQRVPDPAGVAADPGRGDRRIIDSPGRPAASWTTRYIAVHRQRLPPRAGTDSRAVRRSRRSVRDDRIAANVRVALDRRTRGPGVQDADRADGGQHRPGPDHGGGAGRRRTA